MCPCHKKKIALDKAFTSRSRETIFPLYSKATLGILCPVLDSPLQMDILERVLQRVMKMIKGQEHPLYEERLRWMGLFRLERRSLWRGSINLHKYLSKGCKEDRARAFQWCLTTGQKVVGTVWNPGDPDWTLRNGHFWVKIIGQCFKAPKGLLGSDRLSSEWAGQDFSTSGLFPDQKSDPWYLFAFQRTIL